MEESLRARWTTDEFSGVVLFAYWWVSTVMLVVLWVMTGRHVMIAGVIRGR